MNWKRSLNTTVASSPVCWSTWDLFHWSPPVKLTLTWRVFGCDRLSGGKQVSRARAILAVEWPGILQVTRLPRCGRAPTQFAPLPTESWLLHSRGYLFLTPPRTCFIVIILCFVISADGIPGTPVSTSCDFDPLGGYNFLSNEAEEQRDTRRLSA